MLDVLLGFFEALPFVHPVVGKISLCDFFEANAVEVNLRDLSLCYLPFPLFKKSFRIGFFFALCGFLVRPPVAIILDPVD